MAPGATKGAAAEAAEVWEVETVVVLREVCAVGAREAAPEAQMADPAAAVVALVMVVPLAEW